jgi:hypothetical protein
MPAWSFVIAGHVADTLPPRSILHQGYEVSHDDIGRFGRKLKGYSFVMLVCWVNVACVKTTIHVARPDVSQLIGLARGRHSGRKTLESISA